MEPALENEMIQAKLCVPLNYHEFLVKQSKPSKIRQWAGSDEKRLNFAHFSVSRAVITTFKLMLTNRIYFLQLKLKNELNFHITKWPTAAANKSQIICERAQLTNSVKFFVGKSFEGLEIQLNGCWCGLSINGQMKVICHFDFIRRTFVANIQNNRNSLLVSVNQIARWKPAYNYPRSPRMAHRQ